ncbi:MAG: CinA domain protein [Rariglobus sp.]|jgi:nicotinamide-nucleotide amidase|nr:CinA domain protein [Rariglobus sp.]
MPVSAAHELKALCLREPVLTLAVAESMTGGRVQAAITAVPGASGFFLGGLTAYTLDQKVRHLGVKRAPAAKVNAVSAEVAVQMARGAARLFDADVAAATTGYAEPSPAQDVDAPFAHWAIVRRIDVRRWQIVTGRVVCPDMTRHEAQQCVTDAVIAELVAYLRISRPNRPQAS